MKYKNNMYTIALFFYSSFFFFNAHPKVVKRQKNNSFVIMINPAGDAQHKGRTVDTTFEQTITFAFAQALKKEIEQEAPICHVIITHNAREIVRPLATANFANRSEADLFLSIHCYQTTQLIPQLTLYRFSYGEYSPTIRNNLAFYPYDQAYLIPAQINKKYGDILQNAFKQYEKQFEFQGLFEIPFKPLIGIKIPAIGIEIGLKNRNEWHNFIEPFVESIVDLIKQRS